MRGPQSELRNLSAAVFKLETGNRGRKITHDVRCVHVIVRAQLPQGRHIVQHEEGQAMVWHPFRYPLDGWARPRRNNTPGGSSIRPIAVIARQTAALGALISIETWFSKVTDAGKMASRA